MNKDLDTTLRPYVREASTLLATLAALNTAPLREREVWERRTDGHFRRRHLFTPDVSQFLSTHQQDFQALPGYQDCLDKLRSDPEVGPQMDASVGAERQASARVEPKQVVDSLILAMVDDAGHVEFTDEKFDAKWQHIAGLLLASTVPYVMVAPLPGFSADTLPIKLGSELVIDSLTDEEVNRCLMVGVLHPVGATIKILESKVAVGLRFSRQLAKMVGEIGEPEENLGKFGNRPALNSHLLADDVLSTLRLLKAGKVSSPGSISYVRAWMVDNSTGFYHRPHLPFRSGRYNVSGSEALELRELWRTLTGKLLDRKPFLEASLRRFNLAFDRFRADDKLVDLLIAAESLFLSDAGSPAERGELRFRLALRAGKFVDSTDLTPREVYKLMLKAYSLRSQIVHSGKVSKDTHPGEIKGPVEEIIRMGLRKAIHVGNLESKFGTVEYWEDLMFATNTKKITNLHVG